MNRLLKSGWADRLGSVAGTACVLHCALAPVLVALAPTVGVWWLVDEHYHDGALVFLAALAAGATWASTRAHRRFYAWFLVGPGLAALLASAAAQGQSLSSALMMVGGTLIVAGHLLNLKLAHGHVHDSRCGHH